MKYWNKAWCLFALVLAGCGSPDPPLHTEDSKGRPGWTKEEKKETTRQSSSSSTQWERTGTHEVEQR